MNTHARGMSSRWLFPGILAPVVLAVAAGVFLRATANSGAVRNLHLVFHDPRARAVTVLWNTPHRLERPVVRYHQVSGDDSAPCAHAAVAPEIEQPAEALRDTGSRDWRYRATLAGLEPGARYCYRIADSGGAIVDYRAFRSAVRPGDPFTVLAFGDSRQSKRHRNSPIRRSLADVIGREDLPHLTIFTGDMVDDGSSYRQWVQWFADFSPVFERSPLVPVYGNHEAKENKHEVVYYRFFPSPGGGRWFSLDYGNLHLVVLNTEVPYSASPWSMWQEQARWFAHDMERAAARPDILWRVVACHKPPYSTGHHAVEKDSRDVQRHLPPLFDAHGVDLVLSAHDHYYQRSYPLRDGRVTDRSASVYRNPRGVMYLVTAGAGAPLTHGAPAEWVAKYREAYHYCLIAFGPGRELVITATDINGDLIERVRIVK